MSETNEPSGASGGSVSVEEKETDMAYETVTLQKLLREIAGRTSSKQDADAIRMAADTLDAFAADVRHASGRGFVTQEPVAWAVLDSAGSVIHASVSRDACERGFADEEIEQGLSLAPLYAAPPQDRVVRLPKKDWTNPAIVLKVMDALDAAGVKWKVASE